MKKNVVGQVAILVFVLMAIFAACTPSMPDYVSDYDLVYTKEDKAFSFSTVHTYFLPDSVSSGEDAGDHRYDAAILASLKSNLDALGWVQLPIDGPDPADVVVLASSGTQTYGSCAAYCWYCYWGWYPGWGYYPGYPGWGWGYPADIVCASYNTGTVVVNITNPNGVVDEKLPVVWVGILNGLLDGSESSVNSRIDANIDQMFAQSPYLNQ